MDYTINRISGDSIELSVDPGDRVFIVGPNGSGKSALVQHMFLQVTTT